MTWIKICGTTNLEDALASVEAGADALGFIFTDSPRRITPEAAREIVANLPDSVQKIGVFVNASRERVHNIVSRVGLTGVQLHGTENEQYVEELCRGWDDAKTRKHKVRVIKAVPVRPGFENTLRALSRSLDLFLLDSGAGGTGQSFDPKAALAGLKKTPVRFIAAGGLRPENVSEAIQVLKPWGVDVASGVEKEKGKKDHAKLKAFVSAVRQADKKVS
jgi:phosphoribosylanthranilate isomerase